MNTTTTKQIEVKILTVHTVSDRGSEDSFECFELPGGQIWIPGETSNDCFCASRDAIEACGLDEVTGIEETNETKTVELDELRDAIAGAIREFGRESVPDALLAEAEDKADYRATLAEVDSVYAAACRVYSASIAAAYDAADAARETYVAARATYDAAAAYDANAVYDAAIARAATYDAAVAAFAVAKAVYSTSIAAANAAARAARLKHDDARDAAKVKYVAAAKEINA